MDFANQSVPPMLPPRPSAPLEATIVHSVALNQNYQMNHWNRLNCQSEMIARECAELTARLHRLYLSLNQNRTNNIIINAKAVKQSYLRLRWLDPAFVLTNTLLDPITSHAVVSPNNPFLQLDDNAREPLEKFLNNADTNGINGFSGFSKRTRVNSRDITNWAINTPMDNPKLQISPRIQKQLKKQKRLCDRSQVEKQINNNNANNKLSKTDKIIIGLAISGCIIGILGALAAASASFGFSLAFLPFLGSLLTGLLAPAVSSVPIAWVSSGVIGAVCCKKLYNTACHA